MPSAIVANDVAYFICSVLVFFLAPLNPWKGEQLSHGDPCSKLSLHGAQSEEIHATIEVGVLRVIYKPRLTPLGHGKSEPRIAEMLPRADKLFPECLGRDGTDSHSYCPRHRTQAGMGSRLV